MKYFAIFLLGLLAERSFAEDCRADRKVNVTLLRDSYLAGVKNVPIPTIETGDNAKKFRDEYAKVAADYVLSLVKLFYYRGREIGEEQINAVRKAVDRLEKCCESISNNNRERSCVQTNLQNLTKLFRAFLSLIPGNALIKRQALPDLPPLREVKSRTQKRPAEDIFVNLASNVNNDFIAISNFSINIHLTGYDQARMELNTLQNQFRTEILNDLMLAAFRKVVNEALQLQCEIQHCVDQETWESFKNACDRIIFISDDYNASKNNQDCR